MEKTLLKRCKTQLRKLKGQTKVKYCLICFKAIYQQSFFDIKICQECFKLMNPSLKLLKLEGVRIIGFYPYQETIRSLLYKYKGCFDLDLKDAFLYHYRMILRFIFHNFIIVPVPSFKEKNLLRGFNHVQEMVRCLGLEMVECIDKTKDVKQSSLNKNQRTEIKNYLILNEKKELIFQKNVLLVDDVITTGSTFASCIELLRQAKVKHIFGVSMAYVCR